MPLYAGTCETDITPPLGVWMCGYAFRPTGCVAVHDELKARALVLNDGHTALAIVSMDLLGLDFDLVDRVREGVQRETGIPPGALMLAATHTHGGPNVRRFNCMGERDEPYVDMLVRKLISIVKQAANEMQPAALAYGRETVQIGVNRRQFADGKPTIIGQNYAGPVMPWVDAIVVSSLRGAPIAAIFSHACHPTTLGGDNLQITADYCGYACKVVSDTASPIFLQGCAGNINPHPRGTFEDAASHGYLLGEAATQAIEGAEGLAGEPLRWQEETIDLPLIPPAPAVECERKLEQCEEMLAQERAGGHVGRILHAEGLRDYARLELEVAGEKPAKLSKPFTLQMLDLGGAKLLAMPGEMFVQYGLDFARQAPVPALSVAYANGVHGYVPTAADYPYGGYEVDGAYRYYGTLMYTPACEPLIRAAAYRLLDIAKPDLTPYTV